MAVDVWMGKEDNSVSEKENFGEKAQRLHKEDMRTGKVID